MANSTTIYRGKDGREWIDVTENKTLTAADCGIVQNVLTDGITVTLPATVVSYFYIVRNGGTYPTNAPVGAVSDGSVLVTIAPNSVDQIQGAGFTAADNKAALNTKLTSSVSDEMSLVADGVNGYMVTSFRGIWARQA